MSNTVVVWGRWFRLFHRIIHSVSWAWSVIAKSYRENMRHVNFDGPALVRIKSLCLYRTLLRHVDAIQEFTDILVPHSASTVNGSSCASELRNKTDKKRRLLTRLRNHVNIIALKDKLVLLCLGLCDYNALQHADISHSLTDNQLLESTLIRSPHLLAQKVTDLDRSAIILDDAVDREMGVDSTHFVSESLDILFNTSSTFPGF